MPLLPNTPIPTWVYIVFVVTYYTVFWVLSVPLTGVLVRFRANYNPKGLQITDVDEVEQGGVDSPVVGPVVKSYFGMFARVYRLEGLSGLFKGFMPSLIFRTLFGLTPMGYNYYRLTLQIFRANIIGFLLILGPSMTIIYRAMTTPTKLSPFWPRAGLRALLSNYERSNPLRLYKSPGLFLTWIAHSFLDSLFIRGARGEIFAGIVEIIQYKVAEPTDPRGPITRLDNPIEFWVLMGAIVVVGSLVLSPLEVVLVRLSLQRNNGPTAAEASADDNTESVSQSEVNVVGEEDVIITHPDSDPYTGMVACFKRIVKEEGWATLYRGWWITFLFGGFQMLL